MNIFTNTTIATNKNSIEKKSKNLASQKLDSKYLVMEGLPLYNTAVKECKSYLPSDKGEAEKVKQEYPNTPVYLWTGYTLEQLVDRKSDSHLQQILSLVNTLIEGPYIDEERDITLQMRGSKNQRIIPLDLIKKLCYNNSRMEE